jgi:predicted RNA-binding Zn ribbon-like protein
MVIDCIQYRIANSKVFDFLKENDFDKLELQLLVFWAKHPNAKLSLYSITSALDTAKLNLREAIYSLVRKNILLEQHNQNDLTTYALNGDWTIREFIEELSRMDWNQLRILQKQLEGGAILY